MGKTQTIEARTDELEEHTTLSEREAQIQAQREAGKGRQEIADLLGIKKSTVREYIQRIENKHREAQSTTSILTATESDSHRDSRSDDSTRGLFLAPCSNSLARSHFEDTVVQGVPTDTYAEYLPGEFHTEERIPVWGTGEGNASAIRSMAVGDVVAFYIGDTTYSHMSTVRKVERNEDLAHQIWTDEDGETWPYVIYLEEPVKVNLSSTEFHRAFGWEIDYPLGFTRVNDDRLEQIRTQYGSLESYLQQVRARTAFEQGEEFPIDMYVGPDPEEVEDESEDELTLQELRQIAEEQGSETVSRTSVSQTRYARSESVKRYARRRAGGVCEGCDEPAPFRNKSGDPYLEVHHVFEVSDEGPDKPDAVIALCPTCHTRVHQSEDGNEYNLHLIEKLDTIEEDLDLTA